MSKKTFLFFLFTAHSIFSSGTKKVDEIALDQETEVTKKTTPKTNAKTKSTENLDYNGGQVIFTINKDFIFQNSIKAKSDKQQMNDLFELIRSELIQKLEELQKQEMAFEQKRKTAKPEAMQKDEEELRKKGYELQRWQAEQQQEIKEKEESLMKDFMTSINDAVKEFCSAKGNEKVMIVSTDFYAPGKYDASNEITAIMNKAFEAEQKAEKAKKENKK
jgi:Skp family chaperone for outer membrane proteins